MFNLITSYPKSGNTWLRFIIFEMYFSDIIENVSSKLVDDYVPDFHKRFDIQKRNLVLIPQLKKYKVFLKTHFSYEQMSGMRIDKTLLIVRNPLDVIVSLINYYDIKKNDINTAVNEFAKYKTLLKIKNKFQFPNIVEHHDSWLNSKKNLLILRYEDLYYDFENSVIKIANFLEKKIDNTKIKNIKKNTSFNSMLELEKFEKKNQIRGAFNIRNSEKLFMNKGKSEDYFSYLNFNQINEIKQSFSSFMKIYQY